MVVSFYQRERDFRARMLCNVLRPHERRKECTQALTSLEIQRTGSFLKFKSVSKHSSEYWAALRFRIYEGEIVLPRGHAVTQLKPEKSVKNLSYSFACS